MSTFANAAGNFLGNPAPFVSNYAAIASPWGTQVKPGGRVAAYVRSTGAQDGEDHFASSGLLVRTINEGLKRCRAGQNDIVYVLPGHTETFAVAGAIWPNLVAGAQIIGCGSPGAPNAPTITLGIAGASIALNQANVTVAGLNVSSSAVLTDGVTITAAGVALAGCVIKSTGALAANSLLKVTGAADCTIAGNRISVNSTATVIAISGATSTNFLVQGNVVRQVQGTSGGSMSTTAATAAITGDYCDNFFKTATVTAGGAGMIVINAATIATVGNFENYMCDETAAAALVATGA